MKVSQFWCCLTAENLAVFLCKVQVDFSDFWEFESINIIWECWELVLAIMSLCMLIRQGGIFQRHSGIFHRWNRLVHDGFYMFTSCNVTNSMSSYQGDGFQTTRFQESTIVVPLDWRKELFLQTIGWVAIAPWPGIKIPVNWAGGRCFLEKTIVVVFLGGWGYTVEVGSLPTLLELSIILAGRPPRHWCQSPATKGMETFMQKSSI